MWIWQLEFVCNAAIAYLYLYIYIYTLRAKSRRFHEESLGIVVVGGGNPRGNLGCKWNENPRGNSGEIFKLRLKWDPKPVTIFIHQRMTSNHHSLGYIHITETLPMSLIKLHFKFFEGSTREVSTRKYPQGFHRERRRQYPHRKFPFISAGKSWRNFRREDPPEFP